MLHPRPRVSNLPEFTAALLTGIATLAAAPAQASPLTDKTLVVWVAPANLEQRGGGVLSIEKEGGVFDAIVFGERAPQRWMAGSEFFHRTAPNHDALVAETASSSQVVQIAIAYAGTQVTIYRDAQAYAAYAVPAAASFDAESTVLMGMRHFDAAPANAFFVGAIEDARIYGAALTPATLAVLRPNVASDPTPLAWWDFEAGSVADRMGRFASATLVGDARVVGGRLVLGATGAHLCAKAEAPKQARGAQANTATATRALRERLLADPHRPGYHFVAPEGTCMPFDPNGAIFWRGRYHLFYIFQDHRGDNWGHASSADLVHWRHHPTGLVDGMFSGNCFLDAGGRPTMCYHQVGLGNAIAVALDDDLDAWQKLASNPITPPTVVGDPHHARYQSWDPHAWREGDAYYAIFGGKRPGLAKASALAGPWRYVGDLFAHGVAGVALDEDVSCPDFFRLGDQHVLLCISHRLGCRYYLGDWRDEQFHPRSHASMSWSDRSFFAPESLLDDRGRRIMWAWLLDEPEFGVRAPLGWSGVMSLPRVLSLGSDGTLRIAVPEELTRLRGRGWRREGLEVRAEAELPCEGVGSDCLEIALEIEPGTATQVGVRVCTSPDGQESTLVYCDLTTQQLVIDATRSSLAAVGPRNVEAGPLPLARDAVVHLRVFVDRSVVEAFADERQAVTRRVYPGRRDSTGVAVFARGGTMGVRSIEVWPLHPSNPY